MSVKLLAGFILSLLLAVGLAAQDRSTVQLKDGAAIADPIFFMGSPYPTTLTFGDATEMRKLFDTVCHESACVSMQDVLTFIDRKSSGVLSCP